MSLLSKWKSRRRIKWICNELATNSAHLHVLESCARGRDFTPYEQAEFSARLNDQECLRDELEQLKAMLREGGE